MFLAIQCAHPAGLSGHIADSNTDVTMLTCILQSLETTVLTSRIFLVLEFSDVVS